MTVIDYLLAVQERDSEIRQLQREMRDIPVRQKEEEGRLERHRRALKEASEKLKAREVALKDFELETESRRQKILKLRQQQGEIKTNKEFQAMNAEIHGVEDQISAIEDRELGLMDELEQARQGVAESTKALKEEEAVVQKDVDELKERAAAMGARLAEMQAVRDAAARLVEPEWLSRYEGIIVRKQPAIVAVEDGVCGGCHLQLPPSATHDSRKETFMVSCNFCGRLLYSKHRLAGAVDRSGVQA